jgi:hypothetical protein
METLEFIIYPDGRVKEMVTGVVGCSCEEVTRKIEEQLGVIVSRETTSEYFAQPVCQSTLAEVQHQVSYSDWG